MAEDGGYCIPAFNVYNIETVMGVIKAAEDTGVELRQGVYAQLTGPNYETPAEIRAYGIMGANAVGMSTAVEAIAARHMGLKICGVSCITNMAAGLNKEPLSHEEVAQTAARVSKEFEALMARLIALIGGKE